MALAVLGGVAAGGTSRRVVVRAGAAGATGAGAGSLVRGALPPRELAPLPPDTRTLPLPEPVPLPLLLLQYKTSVDTFIACPVNAVTRGRFEQLAIILQLLFVEGVHI